MGCLSCVLSPWHRQAIFWQAPPPDLPPADILRQGVHVCRRGKPILESAVPSYKGCSLGYAGRVESGFEFAIGLSDPHNPLPYFLEQPTCVRAKRSRPPDGLLSASEQLGRR